MKEHPIIFSGPSIKAILSGAKTQTRRIITPQPCDDGIVRIIYEDGRIPWPYKHRKARVGFEDLMVGCPHGAIGDRLWVKEAWRTGQKLDGLTPKQIGNSCIDAGYRIPGAPVWFECDGRLRPWGENDIKDFGAAGRYRHSRFMPRWASRITLEVMDIRVQRLQEISEEDAIAEGSQIPLSECPSNCQQATLSERTQFSRLWDSINAKRAPWASNPFVWCISFRRLAS
jgi:hypothetical protein